VLEAELILLFKKKKLINFFPETKATVINLLLAEFLLRSSSVSCFGFVPFHLLNRSGSLVLCTLLGFVSENYEGRSVSEYYCSSPGYQTDGELRADTVTDLPLIDPSGKS
jgi:asparagine N-glycosylation enzyme membrane subunit Stt3